jgi:hypothetical protein
MLFNSNGHDSPHYTPWLEFRLQAEYLANDAFRPKAQRHALPWRYIRNENGDREGRR